MYARREDFRNRPNIFYRQKQKQQGIVRHSRLIEPSHQNHKSTSKQRISNFRRSVIDMEINLNRVRNSVTPKKKIQQPRFMSPVATLVSTLYTGFKNSPKNSALNNTQLDSHISLGEKPCFMRNQEQIAPLVFIRGQIQISLHQGAKNKQQIKIQIPKIVNYSQTNFGRSNLSLYILSADKPVQKHKIHLYPEDYQIFCKAYIFRKILQESSEKNIELTSQVNKIYACYKVNFIIVLKNEINGQILYWRNYLDAQKLMQTIKAKIRVFKNFEQVL